jgi:hypothetical protein
MTTHHRYYQPSGRVSPRVLLLGVLALPALALAATLYSYITLYLPIIGLVTVILTVALGFGSALATNLVLHHGKVRSRWFAALASLGLGLFTTWFMWVTWGYAVLHRGDGGSDVPFIALVWPAGLWQLINAVNETGAWSFKGATPTGGVLWVMWAIEAAILIGFPLVTGLGVANEPYCEHCDTWCGHAKALFITPPVERAETAEHLERLDFGWLSTMGSVSRPPPPRFTRWDLYECGCRATNAVSAVGIEVKVDDKGEAQVTESPVLSGLLLAPDVVPAFRAIAQQLAAQA